MKFGFRKPNIKKSIKARTTGKLKRNLKSSINPMYGKKGMGYINDPKKAVYNKFYNKTTIDPIKSFKKKGMDRSKNKSSRKKLSGKDYFVLLLVIIFLLIVT